MSEVTNEQIYEVLKTVQADISVLKKSVHRIDKRVTAISQYMSAVNAEQHWQNSQIKQLKRRIEALEDQEPDPEKP